MPDYPPRRFKVKKESFISTYLQMTGDDDASTEPKETRDSSTREPSLHEPSTHPDVTESRVVSRTSVRSTNGDEDRTTGEANNSDSVTPYTTSTAFQAPIVWKPGGGGGGVEPWGWFTFGGHGMAEGPWSYHTTCDTLLDVCGTHPRVASPPGRRTQREVLVASV